MAGAHQAKALAKGLPAQPAEPPEGAETGLSRGILLSPRGAHFRCPGMSKWRAFVGLGIVAGAGWLVWDNWARIVDRMGMDEYSSAHAEAVELCRQGRNFDEDMANQQFLQSRHDRSEIRLPMEPWDADLLEQDGQFRVLARWTEEEEPVAHEFMVNLMTRSVIYRGAVAADPEAVPAAPR